jgi:integrase
MTHVRVRGFKIFRDRHGQPRCYHRATKTSVDLRKTPLGSVGFFAECARIQQLAKLVGRPKPGTLGLLIKEYRASPAFCELSARTRADYQRICDFLQPIADTPLTRIDRPLVVRVRDRMVELHKRHWANYAARFLSVLLGWGYDRGYMSSNPAIGLKSIRRARGTPAANRPWTDQERETVLTVLPLHLIALMMFCGLDPQDAIRLPKTALKEGYIDSRRGKTEQPVWIKLPAALVSILGETPIHEAATVAANSFGQSWTSSGLQSSWQKIKCGLRHSVATILAEMGHDERSIADMLGQKTVEMARHYSKAANRTKKIDNIILAFDTELNKRRTEVVKPAEEVSNLPTETGGTSKKLN